MLNGGVNAALAVKRHEALHRVAVSPLIYEFTRREALHAAEEHIKAQQQSAYS